MYMNDSHRSPRPPATTSGLIEVSFRRVTNTSSVTFWLLNSVSSQEDGVYIILEQFI